MMTWIVRITRWRKRFISFASDITMTIFAWVGGSLLASQALFETLTCSTFIMLVILQSLIYCLCGLYRGIWRFASIPDLIRILRAVMIGTIVNLIYLKLNDYDFPLQIYVIHILLLIILLSGCRLVFRWSRDYRKFFNEGKHILVVGAGSAGEGLMRELYRSSLIYHYLPVAFVDDDPNRHGCEVHGVRVLGSSKDIPKLAKKHNIELILIAIPSASSRRMRRIVRYCEEAKIPFRTLPSIKDIADGTVNISLLRDVLLEDLLGREEVNCDWQLIRQTIQHKSILVTGGGGSIGSELCRQLANSNPRQLIIVDSNEYNLYAIEMELQAKLGNTLQATLGNVTDKIGLEKIFQRFRPQIVFHVAAYKHVPLLESHVRMAMLNNIIGTKTLAELAERYHVENFVLISTDKAVNPSNVMGASKRAAEIFCQTFNKHAKTRFTTVRFGNVLGSAGSVIPLFRKQLQAGGPITVTHAEITRYFMTIPEAAQLILQATTMAKEGEIFVLDMGEPIKIRYLAEQMIKLSGKTVGKDIAIEYTGLRPGEKLHEELFYDQENISSTIHNKINQAKVRDYDWPWLSNLMQEIERACQEYNETALLNLLLTVVPEYKEMQLTAAQSKAGRKLNIAELKKGEVALPLHSA
jgi:FlaA1/EpsC-like NDP-sugar epimerase